MTPPKHGRPVVVRLHGSGEAISARADVVAGEELTLVVESAEPHPPGRTGLVEYTSPRGVHRVPVAVADARAEILRVRAAGPEEVVQRRDFHRVEAFVTVWVRIATEDGDPVATTTIDVSGGGLQLRDPLELEEGSEIEVEIDLDDDGLPVWARCRVIRVVPPESVAVRLEAIARTDRERLVRFAVAREREALRRLNPLS